MYVNLLAVVTQKGKEKSRRLPNSSSVRATGKLEYIGGEVSIKRRMILIFNILDWKMLGEKWQRTGLETKSSESLAYK